MVPAPSYKVPRVSRYSGSRSPLSSFRVRGFHSLWPDFPVRSPNLWLTFAVLNPTVRVRWFGLFRFRSPLLSESHVVFSSSGYLDVSVHRVPFLTLWIGVRTTEVCSARFPHSDISGSMDICSSPKLFAAYHVLHRLLVPRHPPYALISITKRCQFTGMNFHPHMYSVTCVGNRPILFESVFFRLYC